MDTDYIIVGQGIAGTALSYALIRKGRKVLVVDKGSTYSSSKAAAGIFNPVTGKRLVRTWQADKLFPFLRDFYSCMEKDLQTNFLHLLPVYRPYISIEEQNSWFAKTSSPELSIYTDTTQNPQPYAPYIHHPYGGILIRQSGYVDIPHMLEAYKHYLIARKYYLNESFNYADMEVTDTQVSWQGIKAKKILFCEGTHNEKNPYFHWLPFQQVKGELLVVQIPGLETDHIINRGIFILPVGNYLFKVGATYEWDELNWLPTAQARQEITDKLKDLVRVPFIVIDHLAGIRPSSADRRPFIGLHPEYPTLGIFNGLGTKGVSIAPYFAHQFVDYLEDGKELSQEVLVNRYFSLYYKSK
jgi:glycine/D-amino acid oxidase-like deaminating enzyme